MYGRGFHLRFALLTIAALAMWPATAPAQNFDYYTFTLSWAPEYCHENPGNRTPECTPNPQPRFVAHGLWPDTNTGSEPQGCPATPFDPGSIPPGLSSVMPSDLYQHEWQKHGVCSGLNERDYFSKIVSLYQKLKIPIENSGQDQRISPAALRRALAQANAGWPPSAFSIQTKANSLVAVRACMDKSFAPLSCPQHGDTRNTPVTIRGRP